MGGPRGNFLLVENENVRTYVDKYGGSTIPELVLQGEAEVVPWLRRVVEPQPFLFDSVFAEGALLVNMDSRELVIGMWAWAAWRSTSWDDPFKAYEAFRHFYEVGLMRRVFLDILVAQWPGWTISFADVAEFGVRENVKTSAREITPLPIRVERLNGQSEASVLEEFRALLAQLMPADHFRRLAL